MKGKKVRRTTPVSFQKRKKRFTQSVSGPMTSSTILKGVSMCVPPRSKADGTDVFIIPMSAGLQADSSGVTPFSFVTNSSIRAAARLYQEYKYMQGTTLHCEPSVPTTVGGKYLLAWLDSPELIVDFILANDTTKMNIVRGLPTVRTFSLWQPGSISMPSASRRKTYTTNTVIATATTTPSERTAAINEYERSIQGAFVYMVAGAPALTEIGQPYINEVIKLQGLTGLQLN
jgi:hypothetical protein